MVRRDPVQTLIAASKRGFGSPLPSVMAPVGASQLVANVASGTGGRKVVNQSTRPDSWGKAMMLGIPESGGGPLLWSQNESRVVVDVRQVQAPTQADWRIPYTQAIILASSIPPFVTGNFFTRWLIEIGTGEGRTLFTIDGLGVQQITVPAESLTLSYQVVIADPAAGFSSPTEPIPVSAFISDGTTATNPPTFTQRFSVAANGAAAFAPPVGATGFRIASTALGTYTANTSYGVQNNTFGFDSYLGTYIGPIRHQFLPFNGQATMLTIDNTTNPGGINGQIVWQIDL